MEKVETVSRLMELAHEKRAVFCPNSLSWTKPRPAAFVINMSVAIVARMMKDGLYVYEKQEKKQDD